MEQFRMRFLNQLWINKFLNFVHQESINKNDHNLIVNSNVDYAWSLTLYNYIKSLDINVTVERGYNNGIHTMLCFDAINSNRNKLYKGGNPLLGGSSNYGRDFDEEAIFTLRQREEFLADEHLVLHEFDQRNRIYTGSGQNAIIIFCQPINEYTVNELINTCNLALNENIKNLVLLISSTGGVSSSGIIGYQRLREISRKLEVNDGKLITVNCGRVESAAVNIFCAGDIRIAPLNTYFVIHKNLIRDRVVQHHDLIRFENETKDQNKEICSIIEKITKSTVDFSGTPFEQIIQTGERFYTSEKAYLMNLVTHLEQFKVSEKDVIYSIDTFLRSFHFNRPESKNDLYCGVSDIIYFENKISLNLEIFNRSMSKVDSKYKIFLILKDNTSNIEFLHARTESIDISLMPGQSIKESIELVNFESFLSLDEITKINSCNYDCEIYPYT
jgi:ATP-dependent protease ClpP protease subunit